MIDFATDVVSARMTPMPWVSLEQFDHDRGAAHLVDRGNDLIELMHESGLRDADLVAAQDLDRAQLVAGDADRLGAVHAEDAPSVRIGERRRCRTA